MTLRDSGGVGGLGGGLDLPLIRSDGLSGSVAFPGKSLGKWSVDVGKRLTDPSVGGAVRLIPLFSGRRAASASVFAFCRQFGLQKHQLRLGDHLFTVWREAKPT